MDISVLENLEYIEELLDTSVVKKKKLEETNTFNGRQKIILFRDSKKYLSIGLKNMRDLDEVKYFLSKKYLTVISTRSKDSIDFIPSLPINSEWEKSSFSTSTHYLSFERRIKFPSSLKTYMFMITFGMLLCIAITTLLYRTNERVCSSSELTVVLTLARMELRTWFRNQEALFRHRSRHH